MRFLWPKCEVLTKGLVCAVLAREKWFTSEFHLRWRLRSFLAKIKMTHSRRSAVCDVIRRRTYVRRHIAVIVIYCLLHTKRVYWNFCGQLAKLFIPVRECLFSCENIARWVSGAETERDRERKERKLASERKTMELNMSMSNSIKATDFLVPIHLSVSKMNLVTSRDIAHSSLLPLCVHGICQSSMLCYATIIRHIFALCVSVWCG